MKLYNQEVVQKLPNFKSDTVRLNISLNLSFLEQKVIWANSKEYK